MGHRSGILLQVVPFRSNPYSHSAAQQAVVLWCMAHRDLRNVQALAAATQRPLLGVRHSCHTGMHWPWKGPSSAPASAAVHSHSSVWLTCTL